MSDYTPITDFSVKDGLTTGNAEKKILGADFDDEFDAIQTAVATKYDSTDLASQAQAEAGTANTALMTPLRTAEAIAALSTLPALGVTSTATELNVLDGVSAGLTAAELSKLDGVTATTAELNYVDIATLGTAAASKAVTASAGGVINLASLSTTNANIDSGTIDGATVGASSPSTGRFTTLTTTGKTTFGAEIVETISSISGTTPVIDPANGTIQTWTLSGSCTPTTTIASGERVRLQLTTLSSATVTWTSVVNAWIGGSAPSITSGGTHIIDIWKVSTTTYANYIGLAS